MDVESVILASSYLGIFGLMAVNGFASIPSSQILYIIVGYFVSTGYLAFLPAVFLGALGNTIGNVAIYELTRRYGIEALKNFHIYREREVKKMELVFERKGCGFFLWENSCRRLRSLCQSLRDSGNYDAMSLPSS